MRRRLVWAIAGVAGVAVLALAVPLAVVLARDYGEQDLLRLQRDTIAVARGIDLGTRGDRIELPRGAGVLAVYDRSRTRVAGRGPARGEPLVSETLASGRPDGRIADGRLVSVVPIVVGERVVAALRSERSGAATTRRVRAALAVLGGGAVAIIALAVGAALLVGRRLARPLERLSSAARRLGEGDFAVRAPRSGVVEVDDVAVALDHTADRLGELVARERAFSADASHQLRTPLQALRIDLEAIEMRGDGSPELVAALTQVDRLATTIDTLLDMARDAPRAATRCELTEILEAAGQRWRGPLAAAGRPLRIAAAEGLTARAAGPVAQEILDVLLDNACRHGDGGVDVAVEATGDWVTIDVRDEGPGFGPDLESAFARRATAAAGGHGIGLALARSLAHAEGGRLTVLATGPGPTVRLQLRR